MLLRIKLGLNTRFYICLQSKTWEGEPVENKIEEALRRWDADKIGIPDYALESAGWYLI